MRNPVSAVLPIKNGQQWIPKALVNISNLLQAQDELIIIEDHSTDLTWNLLKTFKCVPRLIKIKNPGTGLVAALNEGIRIAQHEWIARFDIDDRYCPGRIERQLSAITPNTVAIFCDYRIVTAEGEDLGLITSPIYPKATALSLVHSDRTAHPSVIFRKSAALSVGLYSQEDFPCEDLSLWLKLAAIGDLVSIPSEELLYSLSKASVSGSRYFEAKEKSIEILLKSGQLSRLTAQAISEFDEILKAYKHVEHGQERSLLFLRDFLNPIAFRQLLNLQKIKVLARLIVLLLYPVNLWTILSSYLKYKKRRSYRILD